MSLNRRKTAQMRQNKPKTSWTIIKDLNEAKSPVDPEYIQNDSIWAQNGPKESEVTKLKWAENSLNELK